MSAEAIFELDEIFRLQTFDDWHKLLKLAISIWQLAFGNCGKTIPPGLKPHQMPSLRHG
jgi:hypothetical protein